MIKTFYFLAIATMSSSVMAQVNDDCLGATPLPIGGTTFFDTTPASLSPGTWPCANSGGPDLWFEYTTTIAGSDLTVDLCGSTFDTALEIFSGPCNALVSEVCEDNGCGLHSKATLQGTVLGSRYLIRVAGHNGEIGIGSIRAIEAVLPSVPDCLSPDGYEDNDDCGTAKFLGDNSYFGLNVDELDNDYFAVSVLNGTTLDVSILFTDQFADVDLYLWDPTVECDTNVAGTGGAYLARGFTGTDDEFVTYTNTSGADQSLIIEVDMYTNGGCNDYDLVVTGAGASTGGIGSPFCLANANSTGSSSEIVATGSRTVADNDVVLTVTDLPTNVFGFFLTSPTQGFVSMPGSSSGNLCVLGDVGRYVGPGQIQNSGMSDSVTLTIDLQLIPSPTGLMAAMGGDTLNFQFWHRDSGSSGPTSNFSNGTSIYFL